MPAATAAPDLAVDAASFPALAGSYQDDFSLGRVAITANAADLSISMPDLDAAGVSYSRTLVPLAPDNFAITIDGYEDQITFIRDSSGRPEYIRDRFFVAKRTVAGKPVRIDVAKLREALATRSRS